MKTQDATATLDRALAASGLDQMTVVLHPLARDSLRLGEALPISCCVLVGIWGGWS